MHQQWSPNEQVITDFDSRSLTFYYKKLEICYELNLLMRKLASTGDESRPKNEQTRKCIYRYKVFIFAGQRIL